MKKIAVITATRAEYWLLSPVVKALRSIEDESFKTDLVVTGTHLSESYGMTVEEIRSDGVRVDVEVPVPVESGSALSISSNQAATILSFAKLFEEKRYDAILILGDRYELIAIALAACNALVPIFHISGGDVTEGAIDESIRHSITKMSYLHFPTSEDSRRRVIQLGEAPERVFNYGSPSIDNELTIADLSKKDALRSVNVANDDYAICTFHPVTLEGDDVRIQVEELFKAIDAFPSIDFIITKSNADRGGSIVNALLDEAAPERPNVHVFASLGARRYLSLMRHALFVLGNSSSGIIETPAFHIPTVNIGDRQRGRLRADSIIDCEPISNEIIQSIRRALSDEMREICQNTVSPYGDGHASSRIAEKCKEVVFSEMDLKKHFRDIRY